MRKWRFKYKWWISALSEINKALWCLSLALLATQSMAVVSEVTRLKLTDSQVESAFKPRRLGLFVGIQEFSDQRFRPLSYPKKDVEDFQRFLTSHNHGDGDSQQTLLNDEATAESFLSALDRLEKLNTSSDDIVIIYLSTHGTLAYEDNLNLKRFAVMRDTGFDSVHRTGVSLEYLQSRLSRFKSQRKALILALCHSGTGKSQLSKEMIKELAIMKADYFQKPLHEASQAMMVLSAASWGQPAREDHKLKNDIYTHFLLEGLGKHDTNADGAVSLFEAHEFARTKTYDFTRGQQTPTAMMNVSGTDPIILNGVVSRDSAPIIFADTDRFRNLQVSVNGEYKGTLWNAHPLKPGRVRLTLVDPQNPQAPLLDHQVYLEKSNSYPVTKLFQRPPAIGIELRYHNVPLPGGFSGLSPKDFWVPGVYLRQTDILGTNVQGGIGYLVGERSGSSKFDYSESPFHLKLTYLQAHVGVGYYPLKDLTLTAYSGLERIAVTRTLAEESLYQNVQSAYVTAAVIGSELRVSHIYGALYSGLNVSLYPDSGAGIRVDNETSGLRRISGGFFTGYSF